MESRVLRTSRWQLGVLMCGALLVMITSSARAVGDDIVLTAISHTALPGGQLQINIRSSAPLPQPSVFRTSAPDRIILDFFGVASALTSPVIDVGRGAVESVMVAQTEQRSRVVINLIAPVAYESVLDLDGLTLVIDQALVAGDAAQATPGPADSNSAGSARHSGGQVGLVDFRRSPDGAGWVILELDIDDARINVREHLGEIVLDIDDASLDASLERRLDVIDFATPVHYVDAFSTGTGVRVVVTPRGSFDFVSIQSGKRFTLEVSDKPLAGDEDLEAVTYAGKTISFDFQNIAVRSALQQIAQETGLNFVISDSVSGDMSLRLQDVPWDQALDTIMQTKGLARREHGNVVWIAPAEEIANQERLTLEASRQVSELEPLVSDLIQVNYAKAEDIANLLKSVRAIEPNVQQSMFGNVSVAEVQTEENRLLSDRGSVTVDSRTNSLLIQDTAQKIREIRKLISELDRPVKQVLIETRIVEANEDFSRNIGVKLGLTGINSNTGLGSLIGSGSTSNTAVVRNDGVSASGDGSLGVNLPATGIGSVAPASYAFTLAKAGAGWAALIDLEISALEAKGNGKIVANPRLLTADKQEAHIEQGQERIFTTNTLGEGTVVTKKAVLSLTVTPQITPDNRVILDVFVTKDSFVSPTEENINTLQVRTQVLLDNGETVVLGGIYEQQTSESVSKVPVLGDLPILGVLFRTRGILDNRRELLIFLTPRIINPVLTAG
ncbi:MAG: type IV pilus secretin PilQ [Acidiferrobacteraceae bacterium]|jgi:type IV pilus assembly protein PilQ|nr:type IV pilus secretin PilQ [Acidiferrobacteraceae bacterium]MBT4394085.1 type IV pilus secretin PilQ [Acidiferrobacteraceae bacterium]MBT4406152.1 type IV pilus secretin PilQ [Acidiferrobacteraceae bacterium]MBT5622548.1 type IV pilus secretin PilQ [Acidiferrobacteraceae bacterium]MBT5887353.1 type IV pilus secretin PilQ [Acidiferrobacteraceae bacterium]